jgi:hypothetical protein
MPAVASAVPSVGEMPVPPDVMITPGPASSAANSALGTEPPSGTTVGAGTSYPR